MRIVVGDFWGKRGPVEGVAADPRYLDISVPPNKTKRIPVEASRHAFAYVFAGSGTFRDSSKPLPVQTELVGVSDEATPSMLGNRSLVLFDSGDEITVTAGDEGIRFLLVSGRPLEEPVAWYGPIVMNTQGGAAAGVRRAEKRHLHQASLITDVNHGGHGASGEHFLNAKTHLEKISSVCSVSFVVNVRD